MDCNVFNTQLPCLEWYGSLSTVWCIKDKQWIWGKESVNLQNIFHLNVCLQGVSSCLDFYITMRCQTVQKPNKNCERNKCTWEMLKDCKWGAREVEGGRKRTSYYCVQEDEFRHARRIEHVILLFHLWAGMLPIGYCALNYPYPYDNVSVF